MYLTELTVCGFRNLQETRLFPSQGLNIVWGANAQGKTNLLEAIYLLGHAKSFRVMRSDDLIAHGTEQAQVSARLESRQVSHTLAWHGTRRGKTFLLDDQAPRSLAELAQTLPEVLFAPEEVLAVKGAPGLRRALLDRALFQMEPASIRLLQEYRRHLVHRNRLLKNGAPRAELDPWTQLVARSGAEVRRARLRLVDEIRDDLQQVTASLTETRELAEIRLGNGQADNCDPRALEERLRQLESQERRHGMTLAGPHRDDPGFFLSGVDVRRFGSQGQQRSFILAFKAALVQALRRRRGTAPVLLLDDITSELDSRRRAALFDLLRDDLGQVFVTTTDPELLEGSGFGQPRLFRVDNGIISTA